MRVDVVDSIFRQWRQPRQIEKNSLYATERGERTMKTKNVILIKKENFMCIKNIEWMNGDEEKSRSEKEGGLGN